MRTRVFVSIFNDDDKDSIGFGRGMVQLLEGVEKNGSIYSAAKEMGMAYSKAWKILKKTEAEFGCALLDRNGQHGSDLTDDARRLISMYRSVQDAADKAAAKAFDKFK